MPSTLTPIKHHINNMPHPTHPPQCPALSPNAASYRVSLEWHLAPPCLAADATEPTLLNVVSTSNTIHPESPTRSAPGRYLGLFPSPGCNRLALTRLPTCTTQRACNRRNPPSVPCPDSHLLIPSRLSNFNVSPSSRPGRRGRQDRPSSRVWLEQQQQRCCRRRSGSWRQQWRQQHRQQHCPAACRQRRQRCKRHSGHRAGPDRVPPHHLYRGLV